MPATKKTVKKVTTKAAAPKATASKKSAKAKTAACACDVAGQSKSSACKKVTRVIAKYNAGWGNQLYIRGLGGGLDWNVGLSLCAPFLFKDFTFFDAVWRQYIAKFLAEIPPRIRAA